jgi:glycosyltransferase involved in cell wall biosynthesis
MTFKGITQKILAWLTYFLPITRVVNADIYRNYKNLKSKYVIPPGLDLDIYYPKDFTNTIKKDFVIGCIGRIEEWKGSNDVTEAVKILHGKGYNVKYKVAFNPVNYDKFELVKPDGDKNLADFYKSLDILVAPGHIQLGAVHYPVIEAMACKTPVITTGYYPANNENAYIVPVKNPSLIANTIIEIMEDYEKATEKAEIAYKTVSQFDWEIVSAKFIDVFKAELEGDKNGKRQKS